MAALLAVVLLAWGCSAGEEQARKPATRLHDAQGESQWLINAIAKYLIEEGYGYPVETVAGATQDMMEALPKGELDLNLEGWQPNILEWYEVEIDSGTIVNLGVVFEDSSQAFVIPQWVADEHDITAVFDMKDRWELFTDPQDPSKGVFYNCIVGWECV